MFGKRSKQKQQYDPNTLLPVIRASICTGEKTAGFTELQTGRFREVMLIRTPKDLDEFREKYGITGEIKTVY